MRRFVLVMAGFILGIQFLMPFGCSSDTMEDLLSSRSYKGHASDVDSNNLVTAFPDTLGTRLDDCQTCHTGGEVTYEGDDEAMVLNQCNFCHTYVFDDPKPTGAPAGYAETLNPFGISYRDAGRTPDALRSIEDEDSDNDGYSNAEEIEDGRYPGDAGSKPGQLQAPIITMGWDDITAIKAHTQFHLLNASKQRNDEYVSYEGVKVKDLLASAGVDLTGATGITVFAADAYTQEFSMDDVMNEFPGQVFYADLEEGGPTLGTNGFVSYPDQEYWPAGMTHQGVIPGEHWLLLAYKRDGGQLLEESYLDAVLGKIGGEGAYRGVIPQSEPGAPDRGRNEAPVGDGWDYSDVADHNAGMCPKAVVAIRVDPMPEGLEEFDWKNGGWALITDKKVIIYGHGVSAE